MQELIRLETADWELTISCQNLQSKQKIYSDMLRRRKDEHVPNTLCFTPPIQLLDFYLEDVAVFDNAAPCSPVSELTLIKPLFFENTQYQFEWVFLNEDIEDAAIAHPLRHIAQSFRFVPKRRGRSPSLIGTINMGNDVGQLNLPLTYHIRKQAQLLTIALEVLPIKMQLHSDLPAMYQCIDNAFPLWRFSLAETTEQHAAKSRHRGHFPLLWLAQFKVLRQQLEASLKVIANSPHSRLQNRVSHVKAARLKGKLSHKLAERVKSDIMNGRLDNRYQQDKKYLSVDTSENRFIKMVVTQCKRELETLTKKLEAKSTDNDKYRLSEHFLTQLRSWQNPLQRMQQQSFLKDVGDYNGQQRESLVLQQKTGYSAVYRVWQELKYYLDVFARHSTVSMKSVAETYEIWCFLTVRQILTDSLGFVEVENHKTKLKLNKYSELQLEDGLTGAGAFSFKREDGLTARLAHEPIFNKNGANIRSYLVSQKPDILLEVTFPDGKKFIWLFDAKYRIKTKNNRFDDDDVDNQDFVPDDAINQMHRYRDALIHINKLADSVSKSRPVFGAFALYPGFYDQESKTNPYAEAIQEIGIGAFALLPSEKGNSNCKWLENFLISQLGNLDSNYPSSSISEALYVNDAARIPYYGMAQKLYSDLTMTIALGGGKGREPAYLAAFKQGSAKWYHLPQKTFLDKYKQHIADEITYLGLAITSDQNSSAKQIDKLWPVKNVKLVPRLAISAVQAGKESSSNELYYLFELGNPLILQAAIENVPHRPIRNSMKLTTLSKLNCIEKFSDVEKVYQDAFA
ncbi:restriction endonuclease-like protein [Moritella yayanosii]|uniref:DUF2357 domain-containing protein n=1 Tax=Moritella yayanosii TaxID=69539 RepID=A0A330LT45_9GAMM|nr:restriction endonuclease-like protein [Moritella yayanosii]SQD79582.1 conserved protein of unknown function [Moritella yayanosii]